MFDGPITVVLFRTWVEQRLVPTLRLGDVVIMDYLGSNKTIDVCAEIRSAGACLLLLPPCSPDLNPIEEVFAKLKQYLLEAQERTREITWQRVGSLLNRTPPPSHGNASTISQIHDTLPCQRDPALIEGVADRPQHRPAAHQPRRSLPEHL